MAALKSRASCTGVEILARSLRKNPRRRFPASGAVLPTTRFRGTNAVQAPFRTIIRISGGDHASHKDRTGRIRLSLIEHSLARRRRGHGCGGGEKPPLLR